MSCFAFESPSHRSLKLKTGRSNTVKLVVSSKKESHFKVEGDERRTAMVASNEKLKVVFQLTPDNPEQVLSLLDVDIDTLSKIASRTGPCQLQLKADLKHLLEGRRQMRSLEDDIGELQVHLDALTSHQTSHGGSLASRFDGFVFRQYAYDIERTEKAIARKSEERTKLRWNLEKFLLTYSLD